MLQVCFSNSEKGLLSYAMGLGSSIGSAVSVITDKKIGFLKRKLLERKLTKETNEKEKNAVPLDGSTEDIICLSVDLSEGDISHIFSNDRLENILKDNELYDTSEKEDIKRNIKKNFQLAKNDLEKLLNSDDDIRIWASSLPCSMCGMLHLLYLLKESKRKMSVVFLPDIIERDDGVKVSYRGWGDVSAYELSNFLKYEREVKEEEILACSAVWEKLLKENAPLRVIKESFVLSADENYYDDIIRDNFPKEGEKCRICEIIGSSLYKIPSGDIFIAKRIKALLENKELVIIDKNPNGRGFYDYIVKRA